MREAPGAVGENIEPAELAFGPLDGCVGGAGFADIACNRDDRRATPTDLACRALERHRIPPDQDERSTPVCEKPGDSFADST